MRLSPGPILFHFSVRMRASKPTWQGRRLVATARSFGFRTWTRRRLTRACPRTVDSTSGFSWRSRSIRRRQRRWRHRGSWASTSTSTRTTSGDLLASSASSLTNPYIAVLLYHKKNFMMTVAWFKQDNAETLSNPTEDARSAIAIWIRNIYTISELSYW